MNIWRLMTHHEDPDRALAWSRQNERIAIGWGQVGDIGKQGYKSPQDISAAIRELIRAGKIRIKTLVRAELACGTFIRLCGRATLLS